MLKVFFWCIATVFVLGLTFGGVGNAHALPPIGAPFETDAPVPYLYNVNAWRIIGVTSGPENLVVFEESGVIRAMRVDADGNTLAPRMVTLSPEDPEFIYYYPSIGYGDGHYLVGWSSEGSVSVQLLDPEGGRRGEPILLDESGYYPHIVWNGSTYLVTWMTLTDTGRDIALAQVTPEGEVRDSQVLAQVSDATEPTFAMGDSGGLIAWYANPDTQSSGIYAIRIDQDGLMVSDGVFKVSEENTGYEVRAVTDGTDHLVIWENGSNGLQGRIVGQDGAMGDEFTIASGYLDDHAVAFDGANYVVVYKDNNAEDPLNKMRLRRVSPAGEPSDTVVEAPDLYSRASTPPALIPIPTGDGLLVAYQGEAGVMGLMMGTDLQPAGEPFGLSLVPHPQDSGTVIFNGTDYVVAWADEREGERIYSLHAVRINQAGQVIDDDSMHLSDVDSRGWYEAVASAGNGLTIAAWYWLSFVEEEEERDASFLRLIHGDGTLGELTLLSDLPANSMSIATDGTGYLAVFVDPSNSPVDYTAYGQLLDNTGAPVGGLISLRTQSSYLSAWVNSAADGYLLSYRDSDTYLLPIAGDGTLSDPLLVTEGGATVGTATNGVETLVVYSGATSARYGRFYADGAWQGDPILITEDGRFGDTTWDGSRFVAVWETDEDIVKMRTIGVDGQMSETEILFEDSLECAGQSIASNGAGQLLLSCLRYQDNYMVRRISNYLIGEPVEDTPPNDTDDTDANPVSTDPVETDTETADTESAEIPGTDSIQETPADTETADTDDVTDTSKEDTDEEVSTDDGTDSSTENGSDDEPNITITCGAAAITSISESDNGVLNLILLILR
jgi:hypothetical protein